MPPIIPDQVPTSFPAGTTVKFSRSFGDFPSSVWTYSIFLNGLTAKFSKAAVAQADGSFLVTFDPTDTASLPAGAYRYSERVSNVGTGEKYDLTGDALITNIEANVETSAAGAFVTFEERTLAVIEAALAGNLSAGIQSYQIAGRAVSKYTPKELFSMRGMLRAAVWRIQNPGRLGVPYKTVFTTEDDETSLPPTWVDITGFGS